MCVLERVVQFWYEILQRWSGWTSGGQQETRLLQPHYKVLIQGELVFVVQEKVSFKKLPRLGLNLFIF